MRDESFHLQGNYAPVSEDVEAHRLEVSGALPPELTGLFVRNGPNPKSGGSPHWFLGDGMLHGVLDASDVAAPAVATVKLPQRVPVGFHGSWVPSGALH